MASRVSVLARTWRHTRARSEIDASVKQMILRLAVRTGYLLAAPDHFTVRTNHGATQNLGLLQLGAAFPFLEEVPASGGSWAVDRLELQLAYYVSPKGWRSSTRRATTHMGMGCWPWAPRGWCTSTACSLARP